MFRKITRELYGIRNGLLTLGQALLKIADRPQEAGGLDSLEERVANLERAIEAALAKSEAMIIKADSRYAAGRAAEERARGREEKAIALTEALAGAQEGQEQDPFEVAGLRYGNSVPGGDGEGVEPVPAMHEVLENRLETRQALKALKRGR